MTNSRIVVTGLIGSIPMAGLTAHYLPFLTGLRSLGHEVLYVEDTGKWTYDPDTDEMHDAPQPAIDHLARVMEDHGFESSWRFVDHRGVEHGLANAAYTQFIADADVFLNVTGAGLVREEILGISRRVYIDTDPGFVQIRVANGSEGDAEHLASHTHHATFGAAIGSAACRVPDVGIRWIPTWQPLDLSMWPVQPQPSRGAGFSTLLKWQTYETVSYGGREYGLKDIEFAKFLDLPLHVEAPLVLAGAGAAPFPDLEARGWKLTSGRAASRSLDEYRKFIASSLGEWSVAKNAYVALRTGWFGDRSAAYLASGRPVVMQSTGFESWLPVGSGIYSFVTEDEAADALSEVCAAYGEHAAAAREIAEEYFEATSVLSRLLAEVS